MVHGNSPLSKNIIDKINTMLHPSDNFTADQIRFLQNEADEWIGKANRLIIEAANEGKSEVYIPIYENGSNRHNGYYNAPDALQAHFRQRGFNVTPNGQSSILVDWKTGTGEATI
jgi:hypothetical protein